MYFIQLTILLTHQVVLFPTEAFLQFGGQEFGVLRSQIDHFALLPRRFGALFQMGLGEVSGLRFEFQTEGAVIRGLGEVSLQWG